MNENHNEWVKPNKLRASDCYDNETDHRIRRWFYGFLRANNIKSVLDVGCGRGQDAPYIIASGASYLGIDANTVNIEQAHKLFPMADFIHGYIQKLDVSDNSFDCVWIMSVWESIPKETMEQAIRECCRVSRRLIVNVDAGSPPLQLRERWGYIPKDWKPTLNRVYDADTDTYFTIWIIKKI